MKFLGISGSSKLDSLNSLLLHNAFELLNKEHQWEVVSVANIPIFEQTDGEPDSVQKLRKKVNESDIVVISTPEHNHSYSASLKNAIDWLSIPLDKNPFRWKVVATMSASTGSLGGPRAQEHLWVVLKSLGAILVPGPEVFLVNADKKFIEGKLTDEVAKKFITELLNNSIILANAIKCGLNQKS
jgi:chromate reductase